MLKQVNPENRTGHERAHAVQVRTFSMAVTVVLCAVFVLLIVATASVTEKYDDVHVAMDNYIDSVYCDSTMKEASAYLTEQARAYVVTANTMNMENYFRELEETQRRETALAQMKEMHGGEPAYTYLAAALERSNDLAKTEKYAMRLVADAEGLTEEEMPQALRSVRISKGDGKLSAEEKRQLASEMLFGESYTVAKGAIEGNITNSMNSLRETTHSSVMKNGEQLNSAVRGSWAMLVVAMLLTLAMAAMLYILILKPIRIYINCVRAEKLMEIKSAYEFKHLAFVYGDIYELKAANDLMVDREVDHDALTGLINRESFEKIRKVLAARPAPMALLVADLDDFKSVNEQYGREAGDRVLQKVAHLLTESFRTTDYPVRLGGDEFAVLLTDMPLRMKEIVTKKVAEINEELQHPKDGLPPASISVGVAFSPAGFTEDLFQKADLALYQVRENGTSGCAIF